MVIIATHSVRIEVWQRLYEALTDEELEGFNRQFGSSYSRSEFAYVAIVVNLIHDLFEGYYGRPIVFHTLGWNVAWGEKEIQIEVEVSYTPVIIAN